jgi:hypothetical protein
MKGDFFCRIFLSNFFYALICQLALCALLNNQAYAKSDALTIALPKDAAIDYRIRNVTIKPGQTKTVRLLPAEKKQLTIVLTPTDSKYFHCQFEQKFTKQDLKPNAVVQLNGFQCNSKSITQSTPKPSNGNHDANKTDSDTEKKQALAETTPQNLAEANQPPVRTTVKITAPPAFNEIDLSPKITIQGLTGCALIQKELDFYATTCQLKDDIDLNSVINIQSLKLEVETKAAGPLEINVLDSSKATVKVRVPYDIPAYQYVYPGLGAPKSLNPGMNEIEIPVKEKTLALSFQTNDYEDCNFTEVFELKEAFQEAPKELANVKCNQITLTWNASQFGNPKIEDSASCLKPQKTTQYNGMRDGELKCVRLMGFKGIQLNWGDDWLPVELTADDLDAMKEPLEVRPKKTTVDVTIKLAPAFRNVVNLADALSAPPCDKIRYESSMIYQTRCPRSALPAKIEIKGFRTLVDIPLANEDAIEVVIPETIEGQLYVYLPKDAVADYKLDALPIKRGQDNVISLSLSRFHNPELLKSDYSESCDTTMIATAQDALNRVTIPIEIPQITKCRLINETLLTPVQFALPPPKATGCVKDSYQKGALECLHRGDGDIELAWQGWNPVVVAYDELQGKRFQIPLERFTPKFPFEEKVEWIKEESDFKDIVDPCSAGPGYKPISIKLCVQEDCKRGYSKEQEIKYEKGVYTTPNLKQLGWNHDKRPEYGVIDFIRTTKHHGYKAGQTFSWKISEPLKPEQIKLFINTLYTLDDADRMPIMVNRGSLQYDMSAMLMTFQSEQECRQANLDDKNHKFVPFTSASIEKLKAEGCETALWALVVRDKERLTQCILCEKTASYFDCKLAPFAFPGKRSVIVIADSKILRDSGWSAIQVGLLDWLKEIKDNNIPLDIYVANDKNELELVLRGEDLAMYPFDSQGADNIRSIVGIVSGQIQLQGSGLHPLEHIDAIRKTIPYQTVQGILFVTESDYLPDLAQANISALFEWNRNQIYVKVATNKNCDLWEYDNLISECETLPNNPDRKRFIDLFSHFIGLNNNVRR